MTSLGPTWGMVGYAPGHIAAVPQPFGYDTVVRGRTTKRIFLRWGGQPDVSTAASAFYTATSDDAGQRFLTSERTSWTALNMVRLAPHGSSVYSYHFVATRHNSPFAEFLLMHPAGTRIVPMFDPLLLDEPRPERGPARGLGA